MSRTGFQYALAALTTIVADPEAVDIGVARSITAGLNSAAETGRELSDLEQLALDNLMGQLTHSEGEASETAGDGVGEPAEAPAESAGEAEPPAPVEGEGEPAHEDGA
jgi:hypothetical protein